MRYLIDITRRYWERGVCLFMFLVFIICLVIGGIFALEEPESIKAEGKRPIIPYIMPWETLTDWFLNPPVPDALDANPFAVVLVNRLKSAPVAKPAPKVPAESGGEPAMAGKQPKKSEKPQEPPKSEVIVSITYKGYYIDISGHTVALVSFHDSRRSKEEMLTCKVGEKLSQEIALQKISEDSATFAVKGKAYVIPWKVKRDIHLQ